VPVAACTADPVRFVSVLTVPVAACTADPVVLVRVLTVPVAACRADPVRFVSVLTVPVAACAADPVVLVRVLTVPVAACTADPVVLVRVLTVLVAARTAEPVGPFCAAELAVPEAEVATPTAELIAADAVRATDVPSAAEALLALDVEALLALDRESAAVSLVAAGDAPAGTAGETADETAETTEAVPEVSGDGELVDTAGGRSGPKATVAACAWRESSSMRMQMPAAMHATCTVRTTMRRILSCGISSLPNFRVGIHRRTLNVPPEFLCGHHRTAL